MSESAANYQSIDAVLEVGVIARQHALGADELHDLVLALAGHVSVRQNHLHLHGDEYEYLIACHRK